ncbi:MAG: hypothetical protein WBL35_01105 [Ornithinibacter sp.]
MTLPVRRLVAVLALGAALVTAGCGTTRAGTAAVVDGSVISQSDVTSAMQQVNSMDPVLLQSELTPSGTLTALIQAPVILDFLAERGLVVSESVATNDAQVRGVEDPSESTVEVIRLASSILAAQQGGQLTEQDTVELSDLLRNRDIEVNPQYGTFNAATASVDLGLPPWVTLAAPAQ